MRTFGASAVLVLALTGAARADQLVHTNLDVEVPAGWVASTLYLQRASDADEYIFLGTDGAAAGPTVLVAQSEVSEGSTVEDDCVWRMEELVERDPDYRRLPSMPDWIPSYFIQPAVGIGGALVDATTFCGYAPNNDLVLVTVILMGAPSYAVATPFLDAIAHSSEWGDTYVPEEETYARVYAPADETTPVAEEPPVEAPKPAPASERPLRIGLGLAYLDPSGDLETGYGLMVSMAFDLGKPAARLRGELRGMAGVDSTAGFWAEAHADLAAKVVATDSVALTALLGGGFDGVGKDNTEMNVWIPYAPSLELGARIARLADDGRYELEATGARRLGGDDDPHVAVRVGVTRQWAWGRLAAISLRYARWTAALNQLSAMVAIRI